MDTKPETEAKHENQLLTELTEEELTQLNNIRFAIMKADPMVDERVGRYLQHERALLYEQEGVFKYALFRTKNYYTFRSAVMYKHKELRKDINRETFFRVQKGCINFTTLRDFPIRSFREWIEQSARMPFLQPVYAQYF